MGGYAGGEVESAAGRTMMGRRVQEGSEVDVTNQEESKMDTPAD